IRGHEHPADPAGTARSLSGAALSAQPLAAPPRTARSAPDHSRGISMNAYIYDGLRSPFGRHAGALASVRPDDLLASVVRAVVVRSPSAAQDYEGLMVGCTNQAGECARNSGRHAALLAGLPPTVGGLTVNRLCGSGLASVLDAARA